MSAKINLNLNDTGPIIRFLLLSVFSFLFVTLTTIFFHEQFLFSEENSGAIALILSIIINFFTAKYVVFQSGVNFFKQAIKFMMSNILYRSLDFLIYYSLLNLSEMNYYFCIMMTLPLSLFIKYWTYRKFVFGA